MTETEIAELEKLFEVETCLAEQAADRLTEEQIGELETNLSDNKTGIVKITVTRV